MCGPLAELPKRLSSHRRSDVVEPCDIMSGDPTTEADDPGELSLEPSERNQTTRSLSPDDRLLADHECPGPGDDPPLNVNELVREGAASPDPIEARIEHDHPAVAVWVDGARMPGG